MMIFYEYVRANSSSLFLLLMAIFAINKIDKEGANPDKVKESLASMNLVVEDWGGKIQSQDISALSGKGIDELSSASPRKLMGFLANIR